MYISFFSFEGGGGGIMVCLSYLKLEQSGKKIYPLNVFSLATYGTLLFFYGPCESRNLWRNLCLCKWQNPKRNLVRYIKSKEFVKLKMLMG